MNIMVESEEDRKKLLDSNKIDIGKDLIFVLGKDYYTHDIFLTNAAKEGFYYSISAVSGGTKHA